MTTETEFTEITWHFFDDRSILDSLGLEKVYKHTKTLLKTLLKSQLQFLSHLKQKHIRVLVGSHCTCRYGTDMLILTSETSQNSLYILIAWPMSISVLKMYNSISIITQFANCRRHTCMTGHILTMKTCT